MTDHNIEDARLRGLIYEPKQWPSITERLAMAKGLLEARKLLRFLGQSEVLESTPGHFTVQVDPEVWTNLTTWMEANRDS